MKRLLVTSFEIFFGQKCDLVARAQEEAESREVDGRLLEERIAEFSERLDGDAKLQQFKSALATPAGQIVLQDHSTYYVEMLRNRAQIDALPEYLELHFTKRGDSYQLRENQDDYRLEFLAAAATFNADTENIEQALHNLANEITGESEADRLLVRFMNHLACLPIPPLSHVCFDP